MKYCKWCMETVETPCTDARQFLKCETNETGERFEQSQAFIDCDRDRTVGEALWNDGEDIRTPEEKAAGMLERDYRQYDVIHQRGAPATEEEIAKFKKGYFKGWAVKYVPSPRATEAGNAATAEEAKAMIEGLGYRVLEVAAVYEETHEHLGTTADPFPDVYWDYSLPDKINFSGDK